uniref:Glucagon / GIP / secretin / VIP family domain-containing protein n=1 Tax=Myripristis murdjan TaxID=586833 RepID=A0A667XFV4_9TELE
MASKPLPWPNEEVETFLCLVAGSPCHDDSINDEVVLSLDREGEALSRRHVDGTFTSDVNKVLDSMAAKEYLLWVMNSKTSGER